jgi:hypothetical protein
MQAVAAARKPALRLLNPALKTFLRSTPGADDIILGSVMSLVVERFRPTNRTL